MKKLLMATITFIFIGGCNKAPEPIRGDGVIKKISDSVAIIVVFLPTEGFRSDTIHLNTINNQDLTLQESDFVKKIKEENTIFIVEGFMMEGFLVKALYTLAAAIFTIAAFVTLFLFFISVLGLLGLLAK